MGGPGYGPWRGRVHEMLKHNMPARSVCMHACLHVTRVVWITRVRAPDLVETGDALSSAYQTWRVALIKLKVHTNRALQLGGGGGLEGGGGMGGGYIYRG